MQSGTANTRHVNSCAATDTSQNREGRPPTANPERGGKVAGLRDFLENTPFWRRNRPKPFVYIRVIEAKLRVAAKRVPEQIWRPVPPTPKACTLAKAPWSIGRNEAARRRAAKRMTLCQRPLMSSF